MRALFSHAITLADLEDMRSMDCRTYQARLNAYVSGEEDPDDAWEWLGLERQGIQQVDACTTTKAPNLIYLGQGHTASTSLALQLNKHPSMSYGRMKEHIDGTDLFSGHEDLASYLANFEVDCGVQVVMDFSPGEYLDGHPDRRSLTKDTVRPELVKEFLGADVKFLIMLRNPVDFLNSLPTHWYNKVMKSNGHCYVNSVRRWMKVFPRDQFMIIKMEDYIANQQLTLHEIFQFVGVSDMAVSGDQESGRRRGKRASKVRITEEQRAAWFADAYNSQCIRELEELTGQSFGWD